MSDTLAFQWAQAASAFEAKLGRLPEDVAPERLRQPATPWAWLARLDNAQARRRAVLRLYPRFVAPWPTLQRLAGRHARLALLDRSRLLRQWCQLALAGRPGVLRCCVAREARRALRETLDGAFEPLMSVSGRGRAVPDPCNTWSPLHWACAGYLDWCALLAPEDAPLRELALLSLPPGLLGVEQALPAAPAELPPPNAQRLVDELELEWSC
jgi:hypothetical protein